MQIRDVSILYDGCSPPPPRVFAGSKLVFWNDPLILLAYSSPTFFDFICLLYHHLLHPSCLHCSSRSVAGFVAAHCLCRSFSARSAYIGCVFDYHFHLVVLLEKMFSITHAHSPLCADMLHCNGVCNSMEGIIASVIASVKMWLILIPCSSLLSSVRSVCISCCVAFWHFSSYFCLIYIPGRQTLAASSAFSTNCLSLVCCLSRSMLVSPLDRLLYSISSTQWYMSLWVEDWWWF